MPAFSQEQKPVNLNDKNGLPTNFIYDIDVDKYGYLWMGTPKGVVKYNGYETKTFDVSSGLPDEDVWTLYADVEGRLWCGTHNNKLGYIRNDKVVLLTNAGFNEGLYPRHLQRYKNGISWTHQGSFYYTKNDTLYKGENHRASASYLDNENRFHYVDVDDRMKVITNPDSFPKISSLKNDLRQYAPLHLRGIISTSLDQDLVLYFPSSDTIWVSTAETNFSKNYNYLFNEKPQVVGAFERKGQLSIRYNLAVIKLNKDFQPATVIRFNKSWLAGIDGIKIPSAIQDGLWDTCIATNTNGLFIINKQKPVFKTFSNELKDYKLVKELNNNNSAVWWNAALHKGMVVKNKIAIDSFYIPQYQVQTIAEIDSTRLFVFTSGISYWYYPYKSKLIAAPAQDDYIYAGAFDKNKKAFYYLKNVSLRKSLLSDTTARDSLLLAPQNISDLRYKDVLYDAYYDINIAYKYDRIIIIKNGKYTSLNAWFLNRIGIHHIERIITDNKGNLFIKDNEKIFCVNMALHRYESLFTHANFADAQMALKNNMLVIAGNFGIAFYKTDTNLMLPHCVYRNVKNIHYNHLYYLQINEKDVLFTTDEGCFTVAIPANSEFSASTIDDVRYKMVLKYNDANYSSNEKDTIKISQDNLMLDLDVINPAGNGKVNYGYSIGQSWKTITGSQVFLTELMPGVYTSLKIIAKDKSWISGKNSFVVYLIPFWWQTNYGKVLISLCIVIFIILVILSAYLITKATVKKRNERNQLRMDIELKSIYSQINPHFIFNTLSGTQYFIRENQTQQARLHLNKFSRLLRSYIHSSRNKYISIKDELSNLVNYIELQQIRFADKFDYKIDVPEGLQIDAIKIPSLLLQPLVENAINHGLFHVEDYKGMLTIAFSQNKETNEIICLIDDTGIGRKRAKEIKANSIVKTESYGDALIKDLINIFNKYEKLNIEIQYIDKQPPQSGTSVILKIKNPVYDK